MPDAADAPAPTPVDEDPRLERVLRIAVLGALVVGVVLRFVTRSPLWLDEALSVNISGVPLGELTEALRRDGHPPLYYALLHGWSALFGTGDVAVRALSGVWALALLPLLWVAGKRLGGPRTAWCALGVAALSPYAIRYGTETRMYAMVMVLALAGWLLLDDVLRRPTQARAAGLALVVGALLWTHYWALWLLAVVGLALLVRAWRARRADDAEAWRTTRWAIGSLVAGGLLFLPWVPSLLYQGQHTGTPWARPVRPTEMLAFTLADLGGGPQAEAIVLGWFLALLVLLGALGRFAGPSLVEMDLRTRPEARRLLLVVVGTPLLGCLVGYALGATYASRYAAVFIPFVLLLAARGLAQLPLRATLGAVAVLAALGLVGGYRNVTVERTDAGRSVEAIEAEGEAGDLVVYCPDQLGPSTSRLLREGFDQVTYPALGDPRFVDWVDYTERLDAADPAAVADELLARAGDGRIFVVYSTSYITHEESCVDLVNALWATHERTDLTTATKAWEPAAVAMFTTAEAGSGG